MTFSTLIRYVVLPGFGGAIGWYIGDALGASEVIYAATGAAIGAILGSAA